MELPGFYFYLFFSPNSNEEKAGLYWLNLISFGGFSGLPFPEMDPR